MKMPQKPPNFHELAARINGERWPVIIERASNVKDDREYLHWDKLRHKPAPQGLSHDEWWFILKVRRHNARSTVPLNDTNGKPFTFGLNGPIMEALHKIDIGAGSQMTTQESIITPESRDRYLVSSLMEEAITSSQLEGAATTREVAKEMIRTGRKPRDTSEQMILNNYQTMQQVRQVRAAELTPELVFELHRLVTEKTLDNPTAAGRLRTIEEKCVVGDAYGEIYHEPPSAETLPSRLQAMCDFANGKTPDFFIHPVIRAVIVHFWLAYDHPFVDGNGRTARALFYWAMLHRNYWVFEFISISNILHKAPIQYGRSFLYTETDDNDLTYFLVSQIEVIQRAIDELHHYIERKTKEIRDTESHVHALDLFNHRQVDFIRHALKHPGKRYTITSHQTSHNVVYQTARADLLDLVKRGILKQQKVGKRMIFTAPPDLSERLLQVEKDAKQ